MLSKEEIEKAFEGMEYFIDDDMGGYYKSIVGNQEANSMLGYLKIRDYILNLQNKVERLESNNQKLIEKLEEDKNNLEFSRDLDADKGFREDEEDMAVRIYIEEILKILKGEKK